VLANETLLVDCAALYCVSELFIGS